MTDTLSAEPPAGPEPGLLARLTGVMFSPGKTFESIGRKPAWVAPLVLVLVWTALAGYLVTSKMDPDEIFDKAIAKAEKQGKSVPAEGLDAQRKVTAFFVKIGFLLGVVWYAAVLFVAPLVYHGLSHGFGKPGKYTAVLSTYIHVQVVQVVKGVLFLVVALQKSSIDPEEIPGMLKSNLGAFLDPETTSAGLRAIATSIDVFDLWGLALMVIGLQTVRGLKAGSAAIIVVGAWAAWVVVSAALATLGAAFGG